MKLWVKWLVVGVLSVVFGVFVLANPIAASVAVTIVAGWLFLIGGGIQVWAGIGAEETSSKVMGIGLGALMILLGISLAFEPLQGMLSLATLATIFIALNGIMRLVTSWRMRSTPLFWPMLISGAVSILLAGYILANFFNVAPQLLGILLGVELLFNGAGLIALALFLRSAKEAVKGKIEARFK